MGWVITILGVTLAIVVIGGAALIFYRRYGLNCKWSTRNIWSVCEEWRQRLSWLWAPREEKVGLVKAQHPTAQTIPGLYRQSGSNTQSHHLLHSDSDLRLDAQGAFTRFEAVDRDLHPPLGGVGCNSTMIPPQPLRPAPQPKPTPRPRPSPLQTHNTPEYLRMQDSGPGPLTPPPIPRPAGPHHRNDRNDHNDRNGSVFIFQNEIPKIYSQYNGRQTATGTNAPPSFNYNLHTKSVPESIQTSGCYSINNQNHQFGNPGHPGQSNDEKKFIFESHCDSVNNIQQRIKDSYHLCRINREAPYRPYDLIEDTAKLKYGFSTSQLNEHSIQKQNSQQPQQQQIRHNNTHVRNDSRGSFNSFNFSNSNSFIESIYGSEAITKLLKNSQIYSSQLGKNDEITQNIEMTPFRNSNIFPDDINYSMDIDGNSKIQGLQRVSQYIQSLPDVPNYDSLSDQTHDDPNTEDEGVVTPGDNDTPSPVPPPAPPDPSNHDSSLHNKSTSSPTTGERIFSALRSVTSQSYIDASEFYNSVLSSAQQVPMLTFPGMRRSSLNLEKSQMVNDINAINAIQDEVSNLYIDGEPAAIGIDCSRRTSDLYSPELNLEAHRTAQEVYNSLQDPPSSPLLLKDLSQEPHPYMSDPSFTRTSEDIFNSLEQRRKSMERLNGFHEYVEMEGIDNVSRRRSSSQDLFNALEEVQLQRRLSQQLIEDSYGYSNSNSNSSIDVEEISLNGRRSSQGPEPEPPPDDTNLKRAISCESVCSDTSVILGDIEEVTVVGLICVGLEYERWGGRGADIEGDLVVSVLEARDLIAPDGRPAQDTFARVCLLPDRQTHEQTRLYRGSPSPSYQEKFLFPLDGGPIGRTLLVEIFSIETNMGGGVFLIGEASLKLGPAARPPATTWLPLVSPGLPVPRLGELMFSLSYLPTAERLTLVVVKARNLDTNNQVPGELFVKVYLLQQGKKIHKKKTSAKRGENSPTFNEAMIFNVPAHTLQTIQLRLTVSELNSDTTTNSKAYSVGHVIIGSNATGKSLTHWRQMLAALRRPVAMWHPLRK